MRKMRKMNKMILVALSASFLCMGTGSTVIAAPAQVQVQVQVQEYEQQSETINPRADIIDWRYKGIDGHLYRRQYNYSKGKWLGEWERC